MKIALRVTPEHPFYTTGRGWTQVANLVVGDACVTPDRAVMILVSKTFDPDLIPVFNLEVEEDHTYFVGIDSRNAVLVHNEYASAGWFYDWFLGKSGKVDPKADAMQMAEQLRQSRLEGLNKIGRRMEEALDTANGLNPVGSAFEAISGETASGRKLNGWERGLAAAGAAGGPLLGGGADDALRGAGKLLSKSDDAADFAKTQKIGQTGKKAKKAAGEAAETAAENWKASRAKGIPDRDIGPSGLPKIHSPQLPSRKAAEDAAQAVSGKGGTVIEHVNPEVGNSHFHAVKPDGVKVRTHFEYPD